MRVTTENWLALTASPKEVHHILDRLDGEVGFMADFGNWKTTGPKRYDDLASILARSEDTHAKAWFPGDTIDDEDFGLCLEAAERVGYTGPYTLIYEDKGGDEWTAVEDRARFRPELLQRRPRLKGALQASGRRTVRRRDRCRTRSAA